jgi:hypothetical protein
MRRHVSSQPFLDQVIHGIARISSAVAGDPMPPLRVQSNYVGEDQFDALVGLLAMLAVVLGLRSERCASAVLGSFH